MPSGALMSLATNSLLNLCAPHGWGEAAGLDGTDAPQGDAPNTGGKPAPLICTATEPGEGQDQARSLATC